MNEGSQPVYQQTTDGRDVAKTYVSQTTSDMGEIAKLDKAVSVLGETITELAQRLSPVSTPEYDTPENVPRPEPACDLTDIRARLVL
jgi:hypothetical protein